MASPSTQRRVGIAILKVLATHALKSIPVVGPAFEITLDVYKAAKAEIDKEQLHTLTEKEVAEALQSISYAEVWETVDAVLASPEGARAVAELNPAAKNEVRRKLINFPSEFDQILSEIEARDELGIERVRHEAERSATLQQRVRQQRFQELQESLKSQLRENQFEQAYQSVQQMLEINPSDGEAPKVRAWLRRRLRLGFLHSNRVRLVLAAQVVWSCGWILYGIGSDRPFGMQEQSVVECALAGFIFSLFIPWGFVLAGVFVYGFWAYGPAFLEWILERLFRSGRW